MCIISLWMASRASVIPVSSFRKLVDLPSEYEKMPNAFRTSATWTLFDAKQLSIVFDYAFKHLASGSDEPFDFSQCRQYISLPVSAEGHFAEFLGRCMHDSVDDNFDAAASVVGSCIVRNSLKLEGSG
jgi:hypothetical protein